MGPVPRAENVRGGRCERYRSTPYEFPNERSLNLRLYSCDFRFLDSIVDRYQILDSEVHNLQMLDSAVHWFQILDSAVRTFGS